MKPYLIGTATVFALLTGAHIWRVIVEGTRVLADPWFAGSTIISVVLCVWALRLLRSLPARTSTD